MMSRSTPSNTAVAAQKQEIRLQAGTRRRSQPDKEALSRKVQDRVMALKVFKAAKTVLFYIDMRSEVRTRIALVSTLASKKTTVIPFCLDGRLELFHLEHAGELAIGTYGALEPRLGLRDDPDKIVAIDAIDLSVVPGVAFDPQGNRLGHGKGYYDRLLQNFTEKTTTVGLAFECQMVPEIPQDEHDMPVDIVITEQAIYQPSDG